MHLYCSVFINSVTAVCKSSGQSKYIFYILFYLNQMKAHSKMYRKYGHEGLLLSEVLPKKWLRAKK